MEERIGKIIDDKICLYELEGIKVNLIGNTELREAVSEISTLFPRWISVDERLPEENQSVLIANGYKSSIIQLAHYSDGRFWDGLPSSDSYWFIAITHWMPLPDLPELPKE